MINNLWKDRFHEKDGGWILHSGNGCPFSHGHLGEVITRGGYVYGSGPDHTNSAYEFSHIGSYNDVMAFRIYARPPLDGSCWFPYEGDLDTAPPAGIWVNTKRRDGTTDRYAWQCSPKIGSSLWDWSNKEDPSRHIIAWRLA